MPDADVYPYIRVDADGTARELHPGERSYLETEFRPGDGAAPYIKRSYDDRDGWGEISGFLERARLPAGTAILPAPEADPSRPLSTTEYAEWLRSKGLTVTENPDGSIGVSKRDRSP